MKSPKDKIKEYEILCAEAYQVVGVLASESNRFMGDDVNRVLDNLSFGQLIHKNVLPFETKKNMPSEKEITDAKLALKSIKHSFPVEYYVDLKTVLDYF